MLRVVDKSLTRAARGCLFPSGEAGKDKAANSKLQKCLLTVNSP